MADKGGYIGRSPGDSAVIIARQNYTPTGIQTDFTFNSGYTPGYVDVYLNGVRLIDVQDYTASAGNTVGLTSYANSGDIVEVIAYKAFNVGNVENATGNFDVGGNLTVSGDTNVSGQTTTKNLHVTGVSTLSGASYLADVTEFVSSGIVTVTNTTDSTSTTTGALQVRGGVGVALSMTVGGNLSVGGTITYEDVTNVDAIGIVTAAKGFRATAGGVVVTAGVSTFPVVAVSAGTTTKDLLVTGVTTATGNVLIGGPTHSRELSVHAATNASICIEGASNGTSNLMFGDENDEDAGMIQYNHVDNDLAFTVNTGEQFAIKSDGQLVASGTGSELNITNTGSTATEQTAVLYTSGSGIHNQIQIKTNTNNGGDPYIKFDGGGQDMIVGERYAGTTNNLLVLGPGNDPDTTSGIFVKGTGYAGVGTDNPATILHVQANVGDLLRLDRNNTGAVGNQIAFRHNNAGTLEETGSINCVSTANAATGTLLFYTKASGGSNAEKLRITSTGQLQATSAADVRLTLGSSGTAGTNDSVHVRADSADLKFMAASGGNTIFEENGTERLRINTAGNLLQTLSTDAQGFKQLNSNNHYIYNIIDCNRSAANDHILIQQGRWNGTNVAALKFKAGSDTSNKDDGYVTFETSSASNQTERARIDHEGLKLKSLDTGGGISINSLDSTSNYALFSANANRPNENDLILGLSGSWNGDSVAQIDFRCGADTTNKDDGKIFFYTQATNAGGLVERLCIDNAGNLDVPDNGKIRLGASNDLQIFHNGSDNIINDQTNSSLRIQNQGNNIWEFGNGFLKGNDGKEIILGDSSDLKISHNGSNSIIEDSGTGSLYLKTNSHLYILDGDDDTLFEAVHDGGINLKYNNTTRLSTSSSGAIVYGNSGTIFQASCATNSLATVNFSNTEANNSGDMRLFIGTAANQGSDPYIMFDSGGSNMIVGQHWLGTTNNELRLGTGNAVHTVSGIAINGSGHVFLNAINSGSGHSDIRYNTSSKQIFYDSSSRLVKTDIEDLSYGLDAINQLRPRIYKRTDIDGSIEVGFIADEVVDIIPEIVPTSEKSLFTKNEEDTEIVPSYVEYKRLTAVLTKAVQELSSKNEALEARIAALES